MMLPFFFSVASKPLLAVKPPMGFTTARRRRENKKTVCLWHLLKDDMVGSNTCCIQDNWQNTRQLSCETRMNSCYSGIEYKLSFGRAPHHRFFHYNLGLECIILLCLFLSRSVGGTDTDTTKISESLWVVLWNIQINWFEKFGPF